MDVLTLAISVAIFFLGTVLIYGILKTYTTLSVNAVILKSRTKSVLEAEANKIKKRADTAKRLEKIRKYATSIPWFQVSDNYMENLNYYAKRLNLVWNDNTLTGMDLFGFQAILQFIYVGVVFVLVIVGSLWFLPLLILYRFPSIVFKAIFEAEIKEHNDLLLKDFRDFYAEFFYNYRHKSNRSVRITDVAMRFYNRANKETKLLIDNLRADSVQSEEYALDQMKDLFRVVKIHRLADQIKMIITGKTLNTDAMEGFKQEIEAEFRAERKKELELKKFKATLVQGVAWLIITEIVLAFGLSALIPV